jgi:hypothetical protein
MSFLHNFLRYLSLDISTSHNENSQPAELLKKRQNEWKLSPAES